MSRRPAGGLELPALPLRIRLIRTFVFSASLIDFLFILAISGLSEKTSRIGYLLGFVAAAILLAHLALIAFYAVVQWARAITGFFIVLTFYLLCATLLLLSVTFLGGKWGGLGLWAAVCVGGCGISLNSLLLIRLLVNLRLYNAYWLEAQAHKKWWSLDPAKLQVGDIIGTREHNRKSELIRRSTGGGPISHVALYIGDNTVVEAVLPRTRRKAAAYYVLTTDSSTFCVLRPKASIVRFDEDKRRADALVKGAIWHSDDLYSLASAAGFKLHHLRRLAASDAIICSELVVRAYDFAGIELCPGARPGEISPNAIYRSKMLLDITPQCTIPTGVDEYALRKRRREESFRIVIWLGALLWAVSPARRARLIPPEHWSGIHFWGSFSWEAVRTCPLWFAASVALPFARWLLSTKTGRALALTFTSSATWQFIYAQAPTDLGMAQLIIHHGRQVVEGEDPFPRESWNRLYRGLQARKLKLWEKMLAECEAILISSKLVREV